MEIYHLRDPLIHALIPFENLEGLIGIPTKEGGKEALNQFAKGVSDRAFSDGHIIQANVFMCLVDH